MILKGGGGEEEFFPLDQPQLFRCSTELTSVKLFGQGLSGRLSSISLVKLTPLLSHDMLCFLHNKAMTFIILKAVIRHLKSTITLFQLAPVLPQSDAWSWLINGYAIKEHTHINCQEKVWKHANVLLLCSVGSIQSNCSMNGSKEKWTKNCFFCKHALAC